jgi:hypothetical protein
MHVVVSRCVDVLHVRGRGVAEPGLDRCQQPDLPEAPAHLVGAVGTADQQLCGDECAHQSVRRRQRKGRATGDLR